MLHTEPRQAGLSLAPPRDPGQTRPGPTWYDVQGRQENRQGFHDLAELGRHVVRLSQDRGLRISAHPALIAVAGCAQPFPAWSVYALEPDGSEAWLGHAAIGDAARERLEAAILAARAGRRAA